MQEIRQPRGSQEGSNAEAARAFSGRPSFSFADSRVSTAQLHRTVEMIGASPRVAAQRRMAEAMSGKIIQRSRQGPNVVGAFTSIPNGTLATTLQDWKILADFDMKATFATDNTPAGRWGEYRQYIRGYFRTTNHATQTSTDLVHPLCPGTTLSAVNWQEDGDAGGGYGRRANSAAGDQYTDLGAGGSKYEGEDHPESDPVQPGNTLRMYLEFKGQLIATGGGVADTVLAESLWSIDKSRTRNAPP